MSIWEDWNGGIGKMKLKMMCFAAVCLLIVSISTAEALPLYTVTDPGGRMGNGGPFRIVGNNLDFLTLCVETREYLTLPDSLYGSIDSVVIFGSGDKWNTVPIADQTARLYNYFLDNQGLTNAQKWDIQKAIWTYQQQPDYLTPPALGVNTFYDNALNYPMTRTIMVLNLWESDVSLLPYIIGNDDAYAAKAQSQLIAVPEPGILILLGIAMTAVGVASHYVRKI